MTRVALAMAVIAAVAIGSPSVAIGDEPVAHEAERAKVCMMQDKVQPTPGIAHDFEGKTYYLCCPMCVTTFDGDPTRYSRASDPVSGKEVDKATAPLLEYRDNAYFFESEQTKAAFAREPGRFVR